VRILGALLFVVGGAGTAYTTWAVYQHSRPKDVLLAVAAPTAFLVALVGLLLVFVPGFFG
jgi:hypothetical protein